MSTYHDGGLAQARLAARTYADRRNKAALPPRQREEVRAVSEALAQMESGENGATVVRFLTMYHIARSHTLEGAAAEVGYSVRQCIRYNQRFLRLIAQKLGYQ